MAKRPSRVITPNISGAGAPAAKAARVIRASCQLSSSGMFGLNSFTT